jgi:hypothetical protein
MTHTARLAGAFSIVLALCLAACGEDRSPKPAGAWTVVDEGVEFEVTWSVLRVDSTRPDAVCLAVEVDPAPSTAFDAVGSDTLYRGHSPGCVTAPAGDVLARVIRISDGDDNSYGLLLGLVPDGTPTEVILRSGQRLGNLVVDTEPAADPLLALFDPDDPPVELVLNDGDGEELRCTLTRDGAARSNCLSAGD